MIIKKNTDVKGKPNPKKAARAIGDGQKTKTNPYFYPLRLATSALRLLVFQVFDDRFPHLFH
jgi:hypothetical protein